MACGSGALLADLVSGRVPDIQHQDMGISRYHMYLMVYFHHKSIIYEEILCRYLRSKDCDFSLPSSIEEYLLYDDYKLHTNISQSENSWARLIATRKPYRMLYESLRHWCNLKRIYPKRHSLKFIWLMRGGLSATSAILSKPYLVCCRQDLTAVVHRRNSLINSLGYSASVSSILGHLY